MFEIQTLITFFFAATLLALAPGPDNLFVLSQSLLRGPLAGVVITLGLCTGLVFHTLAVALGVAALVQASATAFTALKLIGAGYLLYLAWQAFRAAGTANVANAASRLTLAQLYRRGIVMNITNPKVSIFFLAFLPQFADPARGSLTAQLSILGGLFMLSALLVFSAVSGLAGGLGRRFAASATAQRVLNRLAGTLFVLLALRLAVAERA